MLVLCSFEERFPFLIRFPKIILFYLQLEFTSILVLIIVFMIFRLYLHEKYHELLIIA